MIIGITGLIGSGKDTIASHLVEKYNYERYSWAIPLKDITAQLFGWDRDMLEGTTQSQRLEREITDEWWSSKLNKNWSPRYALQFIGTEVMRNALHPDIWILAGMKRIAGKTNVVIPDTRFPNEIKAIKEMGGVIWNVQRGSLPEWYNALTKFKETPNVTFELIEWYMKENFPSVHASEYSWHGTKFDAVFYNNETIDRLKHSIDSVIGN
jgi:hypothetical protein